MNSLSLHAVNVSSSYEVSAVNDGCYPPSDVKVRDTIIAIIDEFFVENNTPLLYICETGDKKQALRNRLFECWFSMYERKAQYTFVASSLKDEEGIENYTAIIVRNDLLSLLVQRLCVRQNILNIKQR